MNNMAASSISLIGPGCCERAVQHGLGNLSGMNERYHSSLVYKATFPGPKPLSVTEHHEPLKVSKLDAQ